MNKLIDSSGIEWFVDDSDNKCSVEYFGSEEKAINALNSLENCKKCINCSDCSDCSGCSCCSDCSRCSDCFDCSDCSRCSYCSCCSDCSRCSDCFDCSDCSRCSRCSYCSCCYRCSDCSRCYRCSDCSRCYRCFNCFDKKDDFECPKIPIIKNIHQEVLNAVSQPNSFDMSAWHTCETTHCRAGWVVHLADEAGKELEKFHDTPLAALLIYRASSPLKVSPVRFFETDEIAMADIRRMAELEQNQGKGEA